MSMRLEKCVELASAKSAQTYTPVTFLVSLMAYLKSGLSLVQSCEAVLGRRLSTVVLDKTAVRIVVSSSMSMQRADEVAYVSSHLFAIIQLCQHSGCPIVRGVEMLRAEVARQSDINDKRDNATAVTRMTVRILLFLPLLTLVVGELSGARPVHFLISHALGWGCIACTLFLYTAGIVWIQHLLHRYQRTCTSYMSKKVA